MPSLPCFRLAWRVALAIPLLTWAAPHPPTPSAPPNVLLIISDDHAWSDYGFMGHPHVKTPALDRLAGSSLVFERGYTPVPLCRPALASIITGLYPHQHGVTGNDLSVSGTDLTGRASRQDPAMARAYQVVIDRFTRQPNFVRDLSTRGYRSLQTGKWWEGDPVKTAGFTQAMTHGEKPSSRHGDEGLEIGRQGLDPIYRFIALPGPWLVWYAPMLPHSPHTPPKVLLDKYLEVAPSEPIARYWASIEWFDRTCGELLAHLDQIGQRTNTIVIYTTDNGYIQHPAQANQFAPRSKQTSYEGGVRTPILISWPGNIKPFRDQKHLATNLDLWPTLAGLLDTPAPKNLPGINLLDRQALNRRKAIRGEQYNHNMFDSEKPTSSLETRWVISGWDKLIVSYGQRATTNSGPELYDLRGDPAEKRDLAPTKARRAASLRNLLEDW